MHMRSSVLHRSLRWLWKPRDEELEALTQTALREAFGTSPRDGNLSEKADNQNFLISWVCKEGQSKNERNQQWSLLFAWNVTNISMQRQSRESLLLVCTKQLTPNNEAVTPSVLRLVTGIVSSTWQTLDSPERWPLSVPAGGSRLHWLLWTDSSKCWGCWTASGGWAARCVRCSRLPVVDVIHATASSFYHSGFPC